jgi:hypothetical protein
MSEPGAIGVVKALAAHVDSAASYFGMVIGIAAVALTVFLFFLLFFLLGASAGAAVPHKDPDARLRVSLVAIFRRPRSRQGKDNRDSPEGVDDGEQPRKVAAAECGSVRRN